ncbi:putative uncharacterized protein DDB_G0282133 isoform X2 [Phymastichus coffea]|uniref:putative uncharacterized protein DDB_G0282133 isoform X2 n=1 Tax=Phymastichus coffea TaxID=108790 RepID=UPI00273B5F21|nr:putative uncharacterized protein DDB_G0282133 isoform X2 [Phymastichus coffea]
MPCWFYDKKALFSTPSIQDGIDHNTECQYRKEGAQLIIQIGSQMELGYNTLATGIVYFHRFYMFHSFKTFSPYITACCCLFLAGKAEETPKKSKDIIKIAKSFLSEDKLLLLGEDPREEVMTMEKILLQTMKFDLKVRHPYCFLLKYAKCLKGDKYKKQKMVQMAWTFINDSLCTTLSIQWEPEVIAIAVIYLAAKLVKFKVNGWIHRKPSQTHWWEIFVEDLTVQVVEVLDLYSPMSRYQVIKSSKSNKIDPENNINRQSDFSAINTVNGTAVRDPRLENSISTVVTNSVSSLKDPRLESGSVFIKSHSDKNNSNTPYIVLTQSPATPTVPQPTNQSLHDNMHHVTNSNTISVTESELQENSGLQIFIGNCSTSIVSSPMNPLVNGGLPMLIKDFNAMDTLENGGLPMLKKGFDTVDHSQSTENRNFDFNSNRNTDNRIIRRRGFGRVTNNSRDYNENRPMRNRGFRNYGRNNHVGFSHNRFRRRNFDNNYGDAIDYIENRFMKTRGFGNTSNNKDDDENNPVGTQGFENTNYNKNEKKPIGNRGFGSNNNSNGYNENKLLINRGFGNAGKYNSNCNYNDSKPRMRFNRRNYFQRSEPFPRKFNNNYEIDKYSHKDENQNALNGSMGDEPDKTVNKQNFYHLINGNYKNEEEKSWD